MNFYWIIFVVDEDNDGQISYREFLLIFRYAKTGKLQSEGLKQIASSVNVAQVGVTGAKGLQKFGSFDWFVLLGYFEEKAKALNESVADRDRAYHEQKKQEAEQKSKSRAAFKEKQSAFQ